jgi:hypothetical protein
LLFCLVIAFCTIWILLYLAYARINRLGRDLYDLSVHEFVCAMTRSVLTCAGAHSVIREVRRSSERSLTHRELFPQDMQLPDITRLKDVAS